MKALLALGLLCGSAFAQTGTLDQSSPFGNASFNGGVSFLVWQQEVTVGLGGTLEGFELELLGPAAGADLNALIRLGPGWNTSAPVWTGYYALTTVNTWERPFFDTTSAGLSFTPGDVFVIELWGATGTNIRGSYVAPPGTPLYPGLLYLIGPPCFADCGWRHGFNTYMLAGCTTPALAVTGATSGGTATATVNCATSSGPVVLAYSLAGGGPVTVNLACGTVTVNVTPPVTQVNLTANAGGTATFTTNVPAGTTGVNVWATGFDVASCTPSNGVMVTL